MFKRPVIASQFHRVITQTKVAPGAALEAANRFVDAHRKKNGGLAELGFAEEVIRERIARTKLKPPLAETVIRLVNEGNNTHKTLGKALKEHEIISAEVLPYSATTTASKYAGLLVSSGIFERKRTRISRMGFETKLSIESDCLAK